MAHIDTTDRADRAGRPHARATGCAAFVIAAILVTACCASCTGRAPRTTWSARAAATYLDQREDWWMHWRGAVRDHGTFCISCHTSLPYALARPRLDAVLHREAPGSTESALTQDVIKRVALWSETRPYYTDSRSGPHKSAQSRGTEAVLNALILAMDDARTGQLSPHTLMAFKDMWTLQETTGAAAGAWPWLDFGLEPWEVKDARYYGAAMAALAVGVAPQGYRSTPAIQASLARLRGYLERHYADQPLHQKLALLWAASALPGLESSARRKSIIDAVLRKQHSDGSWSLYSLSPSYRRGRRLFKLWGDGYATAYVTFVLQQAGVPRTNPALVRGLAWLVRHQRLPEGRWVTSSINEWQSSSNPESRFMSDAATAYAVLALTDAGPPSPLQ